MDQWNYFKQSSTSENTTLADLASNFGLNNSRFNGLNGHSGSNSRMSSMNNSNNMNMFGGSSSGMGSSLSNSGLGGGAGSVSSSSGMGSSSGFGGIGNGSSSNMGCYGNYSSGPSQSMQQHFNGGGSGNTSSSMFGSSNSINSSSNLFGNGMNPASTYGMNAGGQQPPVHSSNGYNNHSGQPNRYSSNMTNYMRQQSAPAPSSGPRTPTAPGFPAPSSHPLSGGIHGNQNSFFNNMNNGSGGSSSIFGGSTTNGSSNMFMGSMNSTRPPVGMNSSASSMFMGNSGSSNYYPESTSGVSSSSNGSGFPPISDFKIDTFSMNSNGQVIEGNTSSMDGTRTNFNTNNGQTTDNSQNARETGIIEKLLQTYGFIQCCERQARLFFHFSQFDGNTDHLRIGDPVEFEVTFDRRTGKPIASSVQKISPEVVLSEERVVGAVTTELITENGTETQGRISYENRGECFFLPYGKDDVEGYVVLVPGDKVSFQIATNQRTGNLGARHVRLENPVSPVRYQGVVCNIKEDYGVVERADIVDEIVFNISDTAHIAGGLKLGDDIDFCITTQNGKEVAIQIVKLEVGSVVFEDTSTDVIMGQVIKGVERSPRHNPKEPLPGRIKYREPNDHSEVEVKFGERDLNGEYTLKHGDWVQFNIATDRRDRLKKATNITLLEQSFAALGERREVGTVHALYGSTGYIACFERDLMLHFTYKELINPGSELSVGDELEFTVQQQENDRIGVAKLTAIRIAHCPEDRNFASFQTLVQENLQGQVISLAEGIRDMELPEVPCSIPLPKTATGSIAYLADSNKMVIVYLYDEKFKDVQLDDVVTFKIMKSMRKRKLYALITSVMALNLPNNEMSNKVEEVKVEEEQVPVPIVIPEKTVEKNLSNGSERTSPTNSKANTVLKKIKSSSKSNKPVYQGHIAALKETFGFVETVEHDKEIFFHYSNVEGVTLELGDEVEYTISSRTGPGGKMSAENINLLPKGTIPKPKVLESVYNGIIIRPIRSSNPDQTEYCGLVAVDTDDIERSEQYQFGITGVLSKKELLQKNDTVTFQVDESGWAVNINSVRKKLIATVDTVKGQYGFLNYEAEEGKKLFFHQSEVKDIATLSVGDEVEFVIITNQKTGKSSACNINRIMPVTGQAKRPQRLISQLKTLSMMDQSKPRIIVTRQPKGPDNGAGFSYVRVAEPTLA